MTILHALKLLGGLVAGGLLLSLVLGGLFVAWVKKSRGNWQ